MTLLHVFLRVPSFSVVPPNNNRQITSRFTEPAYVLRCYNVYVYPTPLLALHLGCLSCMLH